MSKLLNAILLLLIFAGLAFLIFDRRKYSKLQREALRLEQIVGRMQIDDATRIHVALIEQVERDHLLWRVHLPANHQWRLSYRYSTGSSGWSSMSHNGGSHQSLLRARIHREGGQSKVHLLHQNGSSVSNLGPQVNDFLEQHWDQLQIEIAASDGQLIAPADGIVDLLSIRVPAELMPTAKAELDAFDWKKLDTDPLVQLSIGTDVAFEAKSAKEASK